MTSPPAVRHIPLDKLVPSPTNVRKTPPSAAEDAELKASIRARGLKQNLVVHPSPGEKEVHAVTAGGRRLKALQELAAEGVIPADFKVPCLVEAPEAALETSLMENRIRAALSPADEFVAMAALIDGGETVETVAFRFGVSERHVRQRLRLGKLAPELLDAYRNGDISLDVVTAFTLGADHQAQLAVWHQLKDQSYIPPYTVRRLLTQTAIPLDSDLGLFVGSAAYEAAGGAVTRDLFSGDDEGFMDDAALVRRLALEKLERKAAELRSSWAWTRAMLDPAYDFTAQYGRVRPHPAELPPEIAGEIERIEERLAELQETPEDEWTDALMTEAARLEERRDELAESVEDLAVYTEKDRRPFGRLDPD
jgi:ParB family chromosome partitioning protein